MGALDREYIADLAALAATWLRDIDDADLALAPVGQRCFRWATRQ